MFTQMPLPDGFLRKWIWTDYLQCQLARFTRPSKNSIRSKTRQQKINSKVIRDNWAWYTLSLALGRWKQNDHEFKPELHSQVLILRYQPTRQLTNQSNHHELRQRWALRIKGNDMKIRDSSMKIVSVLEKQRTKLINIRKKENRSRPGR